VAAVHLRDGQATSSFHAEGAADRGLLPEHLITPLPPGAARHVGSIALVRRELTIKGSYAEMTSFAAAIGALRTGRVRTDGIITHRFPLEDYGKALQALSSDPTAHKVVVVVGEGL
jgi:hypothetical protein